MGMTDGCCCGVFAGFLLALLLGAAATFGFYCYTHPEARENCIVWWEKVKTGGDALLQQIPENGQKSVNGASEEGASESVPFQPLSEAEQP